MQIAVVSLLLLWLPMHLKAQSFNYNCIDEDPDIVAKAGSNPSYPVTNETDCNALPGGYWNYPDFSNKCLHVSDCALAYHINDATGGLCAPCKCENGATDVSCLLKPDLVVSPWNLANKSNLLETATHKMLLDIAVANIGTGPFEVERTNQYKCCPINTTGLSNDCIDPSANNECPEGFELKEQLRQVIYKKPAPLPVTTHGLWITSIIKQTI